VESIFRVQRLDNTRFVTTGGRSILAWSKGALAPESVLPGDFVSYGLAIFRHSGGSNVLYGLSNGDLGSLNLLNNESEVFKAHDASIRDIVQTDNYHFFTCSYDRLIKMWAMSKD
jgi:hypothetical protein